MAKDWFVWEKIRRMHPMVSIDIFAFMSEFPLKGAAVASGIKFENYDIELISIEKEMLDAGKFLAKKAEAEPKWFSEYLDSVDAVAEKYFSVAKRVLLADLKNKTNSELAEIFRELHDVYIESHNTAIIQAIAELQSEFISQLSLQLMERKIKEKNLKLELGNSFALLSQPEKESILVKERKAFLHLLDKLLADKKLSLFFRQNSLEKIDKELSLLSQSFDALLNAHWKEFEWIFFMYEGPALKREYFLKQLKENLDKGMYIAKELEQNAKVLLQQRELVKKLAESEEEKLILSFPHRLIESKASRKDAMYYGCYMMEKLFTEIGKRIGASLDQIRYMTREELFNALEGKPIDKKLLEARIKFSVFFAVNGKRTFLVGKEARIWHKENVKQAEVAKGNELKGTMAFTGFVIGRVKLISHPNEMIKMEKGDVLVSHATNPNLLPAMTKAAAIVTDMGGITCHAAIVSREFRIPCVVGTKFATQILKDGDLVEVNAAEGTIKVIKK